MSDMSHSNAQGEEKGRRGRKKVMGTSHLKFTTKQQEYTEIAIITLLT